MVTRLFIGNIARNVTDSMLVEALRTIHIEAQRVRIATEKETGTPRGFGFIEIESDVEVALKTINGFVVAGTNRPLRAKRAARQPDEDRDRNRGPRSAGPPARDRGPGDGGSERDRDGAVWREEMRGKKGRARSNARR